MRLSVVREDGTGLFEVPRWNSGASAVLARVRAIVPLPAMSYDDEVGIQEWLVIEIRIWLNLTVEIQDAAGSDRVRRRDLFVVIALSKFNQKTVIWQSYDGRSSAHHVLGHVQPDDVLPHAGRQHEHDLLYYLTIRGVHEARNVGVDLIVCDHRTRNWLENRWRTIRWNSNRAAGGLLNRRTNR